LNIVATVGRHKDVLRINRILPLALSLGLVGREQALEINNNLRSSYWSGREA